VVGIGGLGHLALQYCWISNNCNNPSKDKEELAHKLGADVVVSDGQGLREAGGADVILATSNSYKAAADTLRDLRPEED
jgi:dehydrogenase